ncbi:hypothetical protein [Azospirillum sp. TSO5]|uniref:hypothetical protein n=1 Tax=Azospirillum sp. TSO5 TaxID=716760 RepID=UPI000D6158FB|nr:hypothetical protein [Azospirillum sp. TSO5]PWC98048.1 hypothetical protein TSO5_03335 [Azospirillum sp. TSO5]
MTYRLTRRQLAWLRDASTTAEQRSAFFAKGPAEAAASGNMKTNVIVHRPMVRGTIVGDDSFEDSAQALEAANTFMADCAKQAADAGVVLDEIALGIDDRNRSVMEMCGDANLAVERILHLGAIVANPDGCREDLENLLDDLRDLQDDPASPIWRSIPISVMPSDEDEDEFEAMSDEEAREILADRLRDKGLFGFLVLIRTPVPTSFCEHGYGFSWGYTTGRHFYDETIEGAVKQGAAWAEEFRAAERAKHEAKKEAGKQ